MNDRNFDVGMPQTRHADPEAQRVYELYVAQVVAWFRFEAALDANRLCREGCTRGPRPGVPLDLQRLATLRQELTVAAEFMTQTATTYVRAFQAAVDVTHADVAPLDMLDDVLAVGGALPAARVLSWVHTLMPQGDVQAVLARAFAEGRYALHRDTVRLGSQRR